jgi:PHD/YefM family antitoxin component YafN of YafNO toxin-antitoxin module
LNTITIADIKRGGMAALDLALYKGAATIMKRNRPAAIVLTPAAYESLLAQAQEARAGTSALDWLLQPAQVNAPNLPNALEGAAMAQRLQDLKSDWSDR